MAFSQRVDMLFEAHEKRLLAEQDAYFIDFRKLLEGGLL